MRSLAKLQSKATKRTVVACLSIGFLMPLGCKSGGIWTPKMPKFGMPELAFGSKKKEDKIQPPAMNFTPDGERGSSIAQLPDRSFPDVAKSDNSSGFSREPYAVDDESGSSLADIARQRAQTLVDNADSMAQRGTSMAQRGSQNAMNSVNQRIDQYRTQGQQGLESAQDRLQNSIADSRLLPSDRNDIGRPNITGIPGGSLGNPIGGIGPVNQDSNQRIAQNPSTSNSMVSNNNTSRQNADSMGIGSSQSRSDLYSGLPSAPAPTGSNPFPPASTGLPPATRFAESPAVNTIPDRQPSQEFAQPVSVNSPDSGLPPASRIQPNATFETPSSTMPPASTQQTAQPAFSPSPSGGFRPGSTGGQAQLPQAGTTTQHPLSGGYSMQNQTGPGINNAGVVQNPYHLPAATQPNSTLPNSTLPNSTLPAAPTAPVAPAAPGLGTPASPTNNPGLPQFPSSNQYPSTQHGSFSSPSYPAQPVGYSAPAAPTMTPNPAAITLPSYPGTASTGTGLPAASATPPGMVCDGDTCYVPQK